MSDTSSQVYLSYAWKGDSERVANELDAEFQKRGITIVRDKRNLGYKGVISEFMQEIGRAQAIVVVICDKYLKSDNCMYELLEMAKAPDLRDRIFPIVLHDADIYDPVKRTDYIAYWVAAYKALDEKMSTIPHDLQQGLREEIDVRAAIKSRIADLAHMLKDMNTLDPQSHENANFTDMIDAVQARLKAKAAAVARATAAPAAVLVATPASPAAAAPATLSARAVPGLAEGVAELLDSTSAIDGLEVHAVDNAGETTTLFVVTVQDGALHIEVMDKASLVPLRLTPEAWARINRAGLAGSVLPLGLVHKVSAAAVQAEVCRLLGDVLGLPDDNHSLAAQAFDSTEDTEEDGGGDENSDNSAGDDTLASLDDDIAGLLNPRQRGDANLTVDADADDGSESSVVLWLQRDGSSGGLSCFISENNDLPPALRLPKEARRALRESLGFEPGDGGGLWLDLGPARQADPQGLRDLVLAVLADGFGLPRDGFSVSSRLEAA